ARNGGKMTEERGRAALASVAAVHREGDFGGVSLFARANVAAAADHGLLRPGADRGHQRDLALEVDFDELFQLGFGELLLRGEDTQVDCFRRHAAVSLEHTIAMV